MIPTLIQRPTITLPHDTIERGKALLHQQCFIWGQDVRREEGNLLIAYGCTQYRAPGKPGGTAYIRRERCGAVAGLWGFGIFYGYPAPLPRAASANDVPAGAIFIARFDFDPLAATATAPEHAHHPDDLGLAQTDRSLLHFRLLAAACRWISRYERWVMRYAGEQYRRGSMAGLIPRGFTERTLATAWQSQAALITSALHTKPH